MTPATRTTFRADRSRRWGVAGAGGLVAALLYCSWPLGYLTTPSLVSRGLASDLEARGIPFNWLYITLDIVAGAVILLVAHALWHGGTDPLRRRVACVGYGLFGVATAVDAVVPLNCAPAHIAQCSANLSSPNVDDALTGIAMAALAAAAFAAVSLHQRGRPMTALRVVSTITLLGWAGVGIAFLCAHFSGNPPVALQHTMLTITTGILVLLPHLLTAPRQPDRASVTNSSRCDGTVGAGVGASDRSRRA